MEPVDLQRRLAVNVKRLRLESGLSQEELATRCGLHRTYLGAVERGERNVTLEAVAKIALALAVDPADLLRETAP
jgi:transcriptional regulator with XRE-family HTH domain